MLKYAEVDFIKEITKKCKEIYIVGGAVRDYLLSRDTKDIDIVIKENPLDLIKNKHFIVLDEELGIYRVFHKDFTIDVCKLQGEDIEEDLGKRDFTINAIAYDVKRRNFIDPHGGIEDIKKKVIRTISEENLKNDPIRLLRAFRFWLNLRLKLDRETLVKIIEHKSLINQVAKERIKEELVKIINNKHSFRAIKLLYKTSLLKEIIQELKEAEMLESGKLYGDTLAEHLIYSYLFAEELLNNLEKLIPRNLMEMLEEETESHLTKKTLIKLGALLHDIGKPRTFMIRDSVATFWGHDRIGSKMTKDILKNLRFSSKTAKFVSKLVESHMRLHLLARAGTITERAKGRFSRELDIDGIAVIIVTLADSLASSGKSGFNYLLPYATEMIDFYIRLTERSELKKPLLDGYEIMELLNIGPGPRVGEAIRKLLDAQTEGIVTNKEEAKRFLMEVFSNGKR
ncbi:MAG: CCA tRNA nucleotidyltransferase [Thermosulfidibacteraceae bacterium]